ncbi:VCBS repeat-containing protein [candidate division KSB1 bacterium]|nr:VCBS repeat-containing protein [candidate division KSB1 bacterium]
MKNYKTLLLLSMPSLFSCAPQAKKDITWRHLSSVNSEIAVPNDSNQQTATALFDINKDGINDFIITERTAAPSVIAYLRVDDGWDRYVVDDEPLRIEAGSAFADIDGDGDTDVVFGGDGGSNQVWWWENPYPDFEPNTPWMRRLIKDGGPNKHHDQIFGDFDGDGQLELVFWNQGANTLYFAEIPDDVKNVVTWDLIAIYTYGDESEPPQRGSYPNWKNVNEHEGLAKIDIDLDGTLDIIGAGRWFKYHGDGTFAVHVIDDTYAFSRSAAGDFIEGGRPEVFLVVGDGRAPLIMYEWQNEEWIAKTVIDTVQDGHSIEVLDFNGDGHLDLFNAEMRLGNNPDAVTRILLGDGQGNFDDYSVHTGFGLHESRIADLDGDGDYDILGKPYTWEAPRLDIWLQE